jgi:predicted DNA-binding transcriptional regulator YafY
VDTIDGRLRLAITRKRLVKLSYNGSLRVVEPHDYGVQKGTVRLLAYQLQTAPGWRLFDVGKIEELSVLDTVFEGSRGASHQNHHVWDVIYARVR